MDIDNLVDIFNHNTAIKWKPKLNFVNDINLIVEELIKYQTFINLDIYEVLVTCGHNLTWQQEYFVSIDDLNWFKNEEGKTYYFGSINEKKKINTIEEYNALLDIHTKLIELFELQLENV